MFIEPNVKTAFFFFSSSAPFYHQNMKLFALNEGHKRRKKNKTFKNKNRLINERESRPKSSIYEIISL